MPHAELSFDQRPDSGSDGFLLAIDFGGTKIAMATANCAGERLYESEIPTRAAQGADAVIARMFEAASVLVSKTLMRVDAPLLAVGAVTPGIIEPDGIRLAPNNPGWERLALADVLREGFAIPCVAVETDVKAAALAEARLGALANVDVGLYLNLGTGLAAAAVINGRVLRGANGAAGEIGYQLRGVAGESVFADGSAPLEEFVSGRAISDRASALLGRRVSTRDVFELGLRDPNVEALLAETLACLGAHVANMTLLLDPSRIVIGGGMSSIPRLAADIASTLRRAVPYPPQIQVSAFRQGAALAGAILSAADAWTAWTARAGSDDRHGIALATPG